MVKKAFRFPIRAKTILMIAVFGLVLAGIAMMCFSIVNYNDAKANYKNAATSLSKTIALSIDIEKVKTLTNQVKSYYDKYDVKPKRDAEGTPEYEAYMAQFESVKQTQEYKDLQKYLNDVKNANGNVVATYLAFVDYERKLAIYIVYDQETPDYPIGIIDDLYEEDYPMVNNPKLGFVASIYQAEVEGVYLVTAGLPIVDENDNVICYALVDISMEQVRNNQTSSMIRLLIYLISTVIAICIIGIIVVSFTLIKPVKTLQNAAKSYDINNPEKTHFVFSNLRVNVHDEFADLAESMKKMENDINNKIVELTELNKELEASQEMAHKMSELANKDALTGVRNKAAYDKEVNSINEKISAKENIHFGIAMIDLNYLKIINDDYGHDSGDIALIKLCNLVCTIFAHSPVFRIGGDEFVVILKGRDYNKSEQLIKEFNSKIEELNSDDDLLPADKASAAIGYSAFNPKKDTCVDDVFKRADKAMYRRKHKMKQENK